MSYSKAVLSAALVLLLQAVALAQPVFAQTVVTACGTDNAPGGTNLEQAIHAGGDIVIRCATGGNAIRMTRLRHLAAGITIDGERRTSLVGTGSGPMFQLQANGNVRLKGLAIRNPVANAADPRAFSGIVFQPDDRVGVELIDVEVSDTRLPFALERIKARNSRFLRNGHRASAVIGILMAGQLDLYDVTFDANLSRPFVTLTIEGIPGFAYRGRVSNSRFRNNKSPAKWRFGTFLSTGNSFENNGDGAFLLDDRAEMDFPGSANVDDDTGPFLAGALELHWTMATIDHDRYAGNVGVIGGAILIIHAQVQIHSSQFDDNQAGAGGALAMLRWPPRPDEPTRTSLDLFEVKMRRNRASGDGGAILANGELGGDALLVSGNRANANGGAIAWVGPSMSLPPTLPAALKPALLGVPGADGGTLRLSRAFLIDNRSNGPTVSAEKATVSLGNLIAARNEPGPSAAVLTGASIALVNSTVARNGGTGLALLAGGNGGALANTILADNSAGNCSSAPAVIQGANLQWPGTGCGNSIDAADPALDGRFEPALGSPARGAGTVQICATHPLVRGRDAYDGLRGTADCTIGAVEASVTRSLASALPRDERTGAVPAWLLLLLLLFLLLCILVGLVLGSRRRRRADCGENGDEGKGRPVPPEPVSTSI